jgi:hypothetical protein
MPEHRQWHSSVGIFVRAKVRLFKIENIVKTYKKLLFLLNSTKIAAISVFIYYINDKFFQSIRIDLLMDREGKNNQTLLLKHFVSFTIRLFYELISLTEILVLLSFYHKIEFGKTH